ERGFGRDGEFVSPQFFIGMQFRNGKWHDGPVIRRQKAKLKAQSAKGKGQRAKLKAQSSKLKGPSRPIPVRYGVKIGQGPSAALSTACPLSFALCPLGP